MNASDPAAVSPTAGEATAELSEAASRLSAAMDMHRRGRHLSRAEINAAMMAAFPKLAGTSPDRQIQWTLLTELADHQVIKLPSQTRWDSGRPPLPDLISFPSAPDQQRAHRQPRPAMWRPEIHDWAKDAILTSAQVDDLLAINNWLRDSSGEPDGREPLPVQERSWLIFQNEKKLARLQSSALFAPNRLTLDQLAAFRQPPPLAMTRVGPGSTVLVIENSDTFASVISILREQPGPVGTVAFGGGHAFEASVLNLANEPPIDQILYYGDLDLDGLVIPIRASAAAVTRGLPPIEPAVALYDLLLSHLGHPAAAVAPDRAMPLVTWLPVHLRERAEQIMTSGRRIPQEATNRLALRRDRSWIVALEAV